MQSVQSSTHSPVSNSLFCSYFSFRAVQGAAVQWTTLQCSTCSSVQSSPVHRRGVQLCKVLCSNVQWSPVKCCDVQLNQQPWPSFQGQGRNFLKCWNKSAVQCISVCSTVQCISLCSAVVCAVQLWVQCSCWCSSVLGAVQWIRVVQQCKLWEQEGDKGREGKQWDESMFKDCHWCSRGYYKMCTGNHTLWTVHC